MKGAGTSASTLASSPRSMSSMCWLRAFSNASGAEGCGHRRDKGRSCPEMKKGQIVGRELGGHTWVKGTEIGAVLIFKPPRLHHVRQGLSTADGLWAVQGDFFTVQEEGARDREVLRAPGSQGKSPRGGG